MRLPRDISGADLVARLRVLQYGVTRQSGSHIRLTTQLKGEHHITIPAHDPLRVGTLGAILAEIAGHTRFPAKNFSSFCSAKSRSHSQK